MSKQLLNQALLSQVFDDLRNGQLRRCLEMGFTEDDLSILKDPSKLSVLLNTSASWSKISVDRGILQRLLERVSESDRETKMIDQMLLLGASSKMITDLFSLNQREVATRKKALDVEKKQGRWQELDEQKDHELYYEWKEKVKNYQLDTENLMDMAKVSMILARRHKIPMAMIWQAVEKWIKVLNKNER